MQTRSSPLAGLTPGTTYLPRPLSSVQAVLERAIDYAGLFPPASLAMPDAVAAYAAYAASPDAWALGRFVVPAVRLAELASASGVFPVAGSAPWQVSALVNGASGDFDVIRDFNSNHAPRVMVDCVESRVASAGDVAALGRFVTGGMEAYAELPLDGDLTVLARALAAAGASAKIRTGGTIPQAFPAAVDLLRFLRACHDAGVAFKATAGLHHPVRAAYRLTYAPDAELGTMFGYLNVVLAAVLVRLGASDAEALAMLEEREPGALRFEHDTVRWRSRAITGEAVREARRTFVRSFGSCSFREPLEELATLAPW
jgi:hypothetical protein